MLNTGKEARLLGFRYPTIFIALALGGILAASGLLFTIGAAPSLDAERGRIATLASILMVAFILALSMGYSYFVATKHLADVRTTSKAILESLVGGVLTLDNQARITIINRAASKMLELPSKAPYPSFAVFAKRHPSIATILRKALTEEEYVQEAESTYSNSGGKSLVLRTTVSEQKNEDGERVGLIVLVKDASRLVALEQELRKRDRLAAAGSLAAGVAHEIRNPLSAIDLNLRLLRDEVAPIAPRRLDIDEYFEILFVEIARLTQITASFLKLSRPEALRQTRLRFRDSVTQILRLLEPEAREKHVAFQVTFSEGDAEILGDATKLEQVWLNILINAMQAMPSGGEIQVVTSFHADEESDWIVLEVADQGTGIPPEHMDRLFDPYFTTRGDGSGLGLAIADRIVADHGGTIAVKSSPGAGTKLIVRLPAASTPSFRSSL
jgi:signal transduction histidine kinase